MNRKIYVFVPALLLIVSLFMPALNVSGREEFGYSLFALGWFQSYISLTAIGNWISHGMLDSENFIASIFTAFPWFGNIFIILAVVSLARSRVKVSLLFSILALICVTVFFVNPVAMLGADGITVEVTPLIGAYFWGLSTLACFCSVVYQSWRAKENA